MIPGDWIEDARCRNSTNPDLFFPGAGDDTRRVIQFCNGCPVREQCLDYAMRLEGGNTARSVSRHGIWGGKSATQRGEIRMGRATRERTEPALDAPKYRAKVQALYAQGWTWADLRHEWPTITGNSRSDRSLRDLASGATRDVPVSFAAEIDQVFAALNGEPPPDTVGAARARDTAAARGWSPRIGVIQPEKHARRRAIIAELHAEGVSDERIGYVLGITPEAVSRVRERWGIRRVEEAS